MKRVIKLFIVVVTVVSMTCFSSHDVKSLELPPNLFIAQSGPGKCTLASTVMMLRSRMYRSGNSNWSSITESNVKNVSWSNGLIHNFTYSIAGNTMTVKKMNCSGISLANLKSILNQHPEGVVVYDKGIPHAVFVTGYNGDTIYCADTVRSYSGVNRPIASTWQGKNRGSQANILAHISGIWYISSYSIKRNSTIGLNIYNNNGWNKIDNCWYYVKDGKVCSGWQLVDQKWYYLDYTGVMKTGWIKDNNKWYYLDSSGAMQTGWIKYYNKWYYLDSSGKMVTGWLKLEGVWYYLDSSGAMKTGWIKDNNKWYYLNNSGIMQIDWIEYNNKRYYLDSTGAMKTGWIKLNDIWYYLDSTGAMKTGWLKYCNNWYYLNSLGAMHTGWLELNEGKYYLDNNGIMVTGNYNIENVNYNFDTNGLLKEIINPNV